MYLILVYCCAQVAWLNRLHFVRRRFRRLLGWPGKSRILAGRTMDFLDPDFRRRHTRRLLVGYVFITIAILFATLVLLQVAYGFWLGKDGQVIQNGFVFVSSTPTGSKISISGQPHLDKNTNTRLTLASGVYQMQISRPGYLTWKRQVTVDGSSVSHYDYPFLIPSKLDSAATRTYEHAPDFVTQSPDRRWLLVKTSTSDTEIEQFDLKNPKQAAVTLTLPAALNPAESQHWQAVEWSNDNQHVLLSRTVDGKTDFVMLDRTDTAQSVDLNSALSVNPTKLTLLDKKYDRYYVYDAATQALQTDSLSDKTLTPYLQHVLDYQSYGSDIMLYASSNSSGTEKVAIDLLQGGKTYSLREVAANSTYLLNLTRYSGDWYVALGASSENKVYIYKNPITQLNSRLGALVPVHVLKTQHPDYLAFSSTAQFVLAESGSQFSVYDIENDDGYMYDTGLPVDAPQMHATWMDGNRIVYVSGGVLRMLDYDDTNVRQLVHANPQYPVAFDQDYELLLTVSPAATDGKVSLVTTQLRTADDR